MFENIAGVILAGGKSLRFGGQPKTDIVIDGRKIINRIIDAIAPVFGEIIIVTNTPALFSKIRNIVLVKDIYRDKGPAGGIHAALTATDREAVFVLGGDMPCLDKSLIINQVNEYNIHKPPVLVPATGKYIEPLHAIYSKSVLPILDDFLSGDDNPSLISFIEKTGAILYTPEDIRAAARAFTNINTPGDLAGLEQNV